MRNNRLKVLGIAVLGAVLLTACSAGAAAPKITPTPTEPAMAYGDEADFAVTSTDIQADGTYVETIIGSGLIQCDGPGESVAVAWNDPPEGTQSFALVMQNLTREFNYWLLYDIEPHERGADHGLARKLSGTNGITSLAVRYPVAPCPEYSETHTIELKVYALDTMLDGDTLHLQTFNDAILGHVLAEASVSGTVTGVPAP